MAGKGLFYAPAPPPISGGEAALREYLVREFQRIADNLSEGRSNWLRCDALKALPARAQLGDLACFPAGVAGPNGGFYEYSGSTWVKL
jgi:hypothetical protein